MRHGSNINPDSRFNQVRQDLDLEHLEWDEEYLNELDKRPIEYITDTSKSIVSENNSPDIPFRYSLNPYRGCIHGCSYCYARNTHEYLGLSAGLDFETKIFVKHDAAKLFREFLARKGWRPDFIAFSGVTDCYQPAERQFQLTRQCLQVALECKLPIGIVTKNALVVRDLDLLSELASQRLAHVYISITTLDAELARVMEPRTSIPSARLRAIQMLTQVGVPTGVMVAPIIPGLNESEIPTILAAAHEAGAKSAGIILLRLPLTVEPVFLEWLHRTQPQKAQKIESHIRATRDGKLSNSAFGERMHGSGQMADQIQNLFRVFTQKHGLDHSLPPYDFTLFEPPKSVDRQLRLF